MRVITKYLGTGQSVEGDTTLIFAIDEDEELIAKMESLRGIKSVLNVSKLFSKRSLSANAYFWKLCTELANKFDTTKDEIYLRQLSSYGQFVDLKVAEIAYEKLKSEYRYCEVLDNWGGWLTVRCYIGSSHYNSREMSVLVNGTVNDCHDAGISTWPDEEVRRMLEIWQQE